MHKPKDELLKELVVGRMFQSGGHFGVITEVFDHIVLVRLDNRSKFTCKFDFQGNIIFPYSFGNVWLYRDRKQVFSRKNIFGQYNFKPKGETTI